MVATDGSPSRNSPNPTPTLICFMVFSPAMISHESMILTSSMREAPPPPAPVHLTFLGTGDAFASQGRFHSGYFIEADGFCPGRPRHHIDQPSPRRPLWRPPFPTPRIPVGEPATQAVEDSRTA